MPFILIWLKLLPTSHRYFTKEEVDKHLMLTARGSPPLDVLVRTSGAKRLSDFMLWQVGLNVSVTDRKTNTDILSVLREYTNSVLPGSLARLWSLGICSHHPRLPAQDIQQTESC